MAGLTACPRATRGIGLAALILLFGSENLQNAIADGDTRTLSMHHMHTGEDITVTFKRNGHYDDAALQRINTFLRDWRRDESIKMDPHLLDLIWEVYREVDGKKPIEIVCGYRAPQTNAMLRRRSSGVAQFSQHTLGKAIDFYIPDVSLTEIRYAGLRMQRGGVGFYPTSGSPFVHLDTGSVRHWPRMTYDQLARVFPNGKSAHMASDGRKLKNYDAAVAEVTRRGGTTTTASVGDDDTVAPVVAQRSKRGIIERLFGFGEDEDEAESMPTRPAPARPSAVAAKPTPAKPQVASATSVPLPPIRPVRPAPAVAAKPAPQPAESQYTLASVPSPRGPSANDIINSRGMWDSDPAQVPAKTAATGDVPPAPAAAGAVGSNEGGGRFAWLTGRQERPAARKDSTEPPRPPAAVPEQEVTASLGALLDGSGSTADRAPADLALAYAAAPRDGDVDVPRAGAVPTASAQTAPAAAAPAAPRAAPPAVAARTPTPSAAVSTTAMARPGQRFDSPWLRSLILAPSVHYSMIVASLGQPDYRQLVRLLWKPTSVIAMSFSLEPQDDVTSTNFSGAAVSFLPTIRFVTRTAQLN